MTPRKVDQTDLKGNGKLYSEEQINELKKMIEETQSEDQGATFIPRIKHDANRPYSVMSMDNQLYAMYRGEKEKKHLGAGAFGKVKLAQNLESGEWVAMKVLVKKSAGDDLEAEINKHLGTGFTAIYERKNGSGTKTKFQFAMALAPGVSMETVFLDSNFKPKRDLSMENRISACQAVVKEYSALHEKEVLHLDIKLENMIYDQSKNKVSIIDYGLSSFMDENRQAVGEHRGSPFSNPPEISKSKRENIYSEKTEIYGIGCALADIAGFTLTPTNVTTATKNGNSQYLPIKVADNALPGTKELAELINSMLDINPDKRVDLETVNNKLNEIENILLPPDLGLLLETITTNDKDLIEFALNEAMEIPGFDINHIITNHGGLLHFAAMCGSDNALEVLIAKGADINLKNQNLDTPLHIASQYKNKNTADVAVVLFANENIDLNARNSKGLTALDVANKAGNTDMISEIEAEIEERKSIIDVIKENLDGMVSTVKSLLDSPSSSKKEITPPGTKQSTDDHHKTLSSTNLMNAALSDNKSEGYKNVTQLHQAIRDNKIEAIHALLNEGVDVNKKINGSSALLVAARSDKYNPAIIDLLLDKGADVNSTDAKGQTLLHIAAMCDDEALTNLLLAHPSTNVNVQNNEGDTPLHLACLCQNDNIAALILTQCTDIDATLTNKEGLTASEIYDINNPSATEIEDYQPVEPHPVDMNIDRTSTGLTDNNSPAIENDSKRLIN